MAEEQSTSVEAEKKRGEPLTTRELLTFCSAGGFAIVIALLMWHQNSSLNEFMRTTLTEKLTGAAVAQTETKTAIESHTAATKLAIESQTLQTTSAIAAQTKATEQQTDETRDLGEYVKDLGEDIRDLSENVEAIIEDNQEARSDGAAESKSTPPH